MKICCWNVRGLNSPLKQHEVVSLMKKNKLDICGLVETKLSSSAVSFMDKLRLKNWSFLSNVAASNTAHILIFWILLLLRWNSLISRYRVFMSSSAA